MLSREREREREIASEVGERRRRSAKGKSEAEGRKRSADVFPDADEVRLLEIVLPRAGEVGWREKIELGEGEERNSWSGGEIEFHGLFFLFLVEKM
ncbi:hypothetical protein ACOSQ2_005048 [Xanthoceras sorbifolium]